MLSGADPGKMVTVFRWQRRRECSLLKEGGPGKRLWILILLSDIPWAFEFFGQDIDHVSRLKFGKFASVYKKLSTFQKSDRFT